ncbi:uncharacterized protein [Equus asinus]|uniref:uncharacterized protein n=1 Tax=Equus asinus TaxID=9793 RepID=UPI0038F7EF12
MAKRQGHPHRRDCEGTGRDGRKSEYSGMESGNVSITQRRSCQSLMLLRDRTRAGGGAASAGSASRPPGYLGGQPLPRAVQPGPAAGSAAGVGSPTGRGATSKRVERETLAEQEAREAGRHGPGPPGHVARAAPRDADAARGPALGEAVHPAPPRAPPLAPRRLAGTSLEADWPSESSPQVLQRVAEELGGWWRSQGLSLREPGTRSCRPPGPADQPSAPPRDPELKSAWKLLSLIRRAPCAF